MTSMVLVRVNNHIRLRTVEYIDIEDDIAYYLDVDKSLISIFDKKTGRNVCNLMSSSTKEEILDAYKIYKPKIEKVRKSKQYDSMIYLFNSLTKGIE